MPMQSGLIIPREQSSSVYSGDCLMASRERLMKTFFSPQLTRSIHCGETKTFFPGHQLCVPTTR
jgi:hypothetical protein